MRSKIDPATVSYLGDAARGIYRFRVRFQAGGHDMEIDYFATDVADATDQFHADYPQDDIHPECVINLSLVDSSAKRPTG